ARTAADTLAEQLRTTAEAMDPAAGRMFGAVWVRTPDRATGRLLLVIHHLVVDGVSWRILHDDLRQLWAGEELDATGTSVRTWNTNLVQLAGSETVAGELPYWQTVA
ncbi:condensation domain-containing protein, partial [Nocardia farcinica]